MLCCGLLEDYLPGSEENRGKRDKGCIPPWFIISDYPLNTDSEAVEQLVNHIKALKRRCDFKIVYVDIAGNQQPGSLEKVIDFYAYEGIQRSERSAYGRKRIQYK